ncbi:hypothetical protein [Noviherbaspirillum malthae]|uniref:hypothetical protein n=1 Tax=Noviherbaspirillum malthae TaxID=1260987 RepID=UPI00188F1004|nr:hypothetical protein [Noviherbaspirillum malthae]
MMQQEPVQNPPHSPQEIPVVPNPAPEIAPSTQSEPEITPPLDPVAPSSPQGPEIVPDESPPEVPGTVG